MSNQEIITKSTENVEVETSNQSVQNFELGTILHNIKANKYTNEINESFMFEGKESKEKFSIKKERILELALELKDKESASILINNGWPSNERMAAGAGKALKINSNKDFYECIFYIGKMGEEFDAKKIEGKKFIKFDKKHLNAIFTFLIFNDRVATEKAEALKLQRTSLELG